MPPQLDPASERELLLRIARNDTGAFAIVYERYCFRVKWMISNMLGGYAGDLNDITQEVFLKVWKKRYILPQVECIEGYLFTIARNVLIISARHEIVRKRIQDEYAWEATAPFINPDHAVMYRFLRSAVNKAIRQLPPVCGRVFSLYLLYDLSYKQIAAQLGISPQIVSRHVLRGRVLLKEQLAGSTEWQVAWIVAGAGLLLEISMESGVILL